MRDPQRVAEDRVSEGWLEMIKFLLWLLLLAVCWPLAIVALVMWPVVWLLRLPFRLVGLAVEGVFALLRAIVLLPARLVGGRTAVRA
jgi:hypothetical protein